MESKNEKTTAKSELLIVGAGGHAKVVSEIISLSNSWQVAAYLDENSLQKQFQSRPVVKQLSDVHDLFPEIKFAFVAIGSNQQRQIWINRLLAAGYIIPTLRHPTSVVSTSSKIGAGTLLCAHSFCGPDSIIGEGCIVNTGAIIEHDAQVGSFCHISQRAIICGGAKIGSNVLVGPGAVVEKLVVAANDTYLGTNAVLAAAQ